MKLELGCLHKNVKLTITKWCKLKFAMTSKFVNEVKCDALPLDVCRLSLGVLACEIGNMKTNDGLTNTNKSNLVWDD